MNDYTFLYEKVTIENTYAHGCFQYSTFSEKGDQLQNRDVFFFLEYLVLYFHNKLLYLIM